MFQGCYRSEIRVFSNHFFWDSSHFRVFALILTSELLLVRLFVFLAILAKVLQFCAPICDLGIGPNVLSIYDITYTNKKVDITPTLADTTMESSFFGFFFQRKKSLYLIFQEVKSRYTLIESLGSWSKHIIHSLWPRQNLYFIIVIQNSLVTLCPLVNSLLL